MFEKLDIFPITFGTLYRTPNAFYIRKLISSSIKKSFFFLLPSFGMPPALYCLLCLVHCEFAPFDLRILAQNILHKIQLWSGKWSHFYGTQYHSMWMCINFPKLVLYYLSTRAPETSWQNKRFGRNNDSINRVKMFTRGNAQSTHQKKIFWNIYLLFFSHQSSVFQFLNSSLSSSHIHFIHFIRTADEPKVTQTHEAQWIINSMHDIIVCVWVYLTMWQYLLAIVQFV